MVTNIVSFIFFSIKIIKKRASFYDDALTILPVMVSEYIDLYQFNTYVFVDQGEDKI